MTKLKRDMRRKRLEILSEIDRLDKLRCEFCAVDSGFSSANKSICDCPSSAEVIKLGNQLMKLVSNRKTVELEVIEVPSTKNLKLEIFTVELYKKMKLAKVRDVDIFKSMRISGNTFYAWKVENGLLEKRRND